MDGGEKFTVGVVIIGGRHNQTHLLEGLDRLLTDILHKDTYYQTLLK